MKKFILIPFLLLALAGCDKKFNNLIDSSESSYQIKSLSSFSVVDFNFADSSKILFAELAAPLANSDLTYSVYSSEGKIILSGKMYDNGKEVNGDNVMGDNIYSAKIYFKQEYPNGQYKICYYLTGGSQPDKPSAQQAFTYYNHQNAKPPVVSNLIMQDSVYADSVFIFSIKAEDPNGLSDIKYVLFKGYRPDGTIMTNTTGDTLFVMNDSGDLEHFGDAVAGDGIFSYRNTFYTTAAKGTRRFEFFAVDRSGLVSNVIIHYIKLL
jgi:hypothetical protein